MTDARTPPDADSAEILSSERRASDRPRGEASSSSDASAFRVREVHFSEEVDNAIRTNLKTAKGAAALDAAPRPEKVLSNLGDLRTEVGTVLRQLALTMHRADALPPAHYAEKPTVADWRGRAEWLAAVLTKTMARLEDEHLAHLRLAADGEAVSRPHDQETPHD